MSDETVNEIHKYWKWVHGLSPDIQRIVLDCWDETGRPTEEHSTVVIRVLRLCNTWKDFSRKYTELMLGFDVDLAVVEDDAKMYWLIYVAGVERLAEDM